MGQKSDIDVGFNEKIIDEENAIKVIQMYKEVYIFLKNRFFTYRRKGLMVI